MLKSRQRRKNDKRAARRENPHGRRVANMRFSCYTLREGIVSGGQSCPFRGGGFMENVALVLIIVLLILVELQNKK